MTSSPSGFSRPDEPSHDVAKQNSADISAEAMVKLLQDIDSGAISYAPLLMDSTWEAILNAKLIRIAAYPDERIVMLPAGRELLASVQNKHHAEERCKQP